MEAIAIPIQPLNLPDRLPLADILTYFPSNNSIYIEAGSVFLWNGNRVKKITSAWDCRSASFGSTLPLFQLV